MTPDLKFLLLASLIFPLRIASESKATALIPFSLSSLARGGLKSKEKYDLCSHPFHSWRCSGESSIGASSSNPVTQQVKNNTKKDVKETSATPVSFEAESKRVYSNFPKLLRSNLKKSSSLVTNFLSTTSSPISGNFATTLTPLKINIREILFKPSKESFTRAEVTAKWSNRFDNNTSTQKPTSRTTLSVRNINDSPVKKLRKISKEKYSKCSHPFHAWLCAKAPGNSNIQSSPANTGISLLPQPRKKIPLVLTTISTVLPTVPTTTPQTVPTPVSTTISKPQMHETKKEESYRACSHAYHSWLCGNTPSPSNPKRIKLTSNPIPSFQKPQTLTIPLNMHRNIPASKPQIKESIYSKCKHSFHSWLCGRTSEPKQENEYGGVNLPSASSLPQPKTKNINSMNTTTTKRDCHTLLSLVDSFKLDDTPYSLLTNTNASITEKLPLLWKACFKNKSTPKYPFCVSLLDISKCLDKSIKNESNFKPSSSKPSTSKQPSETSRIQTDTVKKGIGFPAANSNKDSQNKEKGKGWDHSSPCNHAFHSWICRAQNTSKNKQGLRLGA